MTRFVMLTDEPERVRRAFGYEDWSQVEFDTAAEALFWERRMRAGGAVALDGQGFRYGVIFAHESRRDGWVA